MDRQSPQVQGLDVSSTEAVMRRGVAGRDSAVISAVALGSLGVALTDEQLAIEAASKNPRWGVEPASFVIDELLVHHVAKHQSQIRRNVEQFNNRAQRRERSNPAAERS